jgi:hypothetical protein
MSGLFGRDFEERADLLRRQVAHQQMLEAQSFKHRPRASDDEAPIGSGAESAGELSDGEQRVIAVVLLGCSFLFVAISHGLNAAAISFVAAVPAAVVLMAITRIKSGGWYLGFWRACITAFAALIAYLAITTMIGFCVRIFHTPAAHADFSNQMAGAMLELRRLIPTTVWISQTHYPVSVLATAFLALHSPGLLFSALILTAREEPYQDGLRGILLAWIVSFIVMPTTLSITYWIASLT